MRKLVAQEQACLQAADRIVTPSPVTAEYLAGERQVDRAKIEVIPNGVDTDLFRPGEATAGLDLLYFGTLASWQGVDLAIRAAAQTGARLTILGAGSNRQRDSLAALAAKLGIAPQVSILEPVDHAQLVELMHRSFAVLAPLALDERNTRQGCCPLKILESMAAGVPVIASDLPVVRALGVDGRHFLLVKPGSVDQIVEAVRRLEADPGLRNRIAVEARAHIAANYTWARAGAALVSTARSALLSASG